MRKTTLTPKFAFLAVATLTGLAWSPAAQAAGVCPSDINKDGAINDTDVLQLAHAYGLPCSGTCPTDIDRNGATNGNDFVLLMAQYNKTCPAITTQPTSIVAEQGKPFTLSVTASGSATLTYQWRKNGVAISGATASTYSVSSAQTSHNGSYDVLVTNGPGNINSNVVTVDVRPVVTATSCSATHVQTALNNAPDGAIVAIPAGTCNWGTATVYRNAGVWIRGAGKNSTILKRDVPITGEGHFMAEFDCTNGKKLEISDLTFLGNDDGQTETQRLADLDNGVLLHESCVDFEIHHAAFSKFSDAGLTIMGDTARGVIYQNDFISNFKCQPDPVSCLGYGIVVYGDDGDPRPPLSLGTQNAVFIEDNYFYDNRHSVTSNQGSRYVVRYNNLITTQRTRNFGIIDAHGRGSYPPGSRSWEIYNNTLNTEASVTSADGIYIRGGDGVIFNNTISTKIPYVAKLTDESDCTGSYPATDQVREAHIWGNSWNGPVWIGSGCSSHIQQNRDYFLTARPGYTPYTYPHPLR